MSEVLLFWLYLLALLVFPVLAQWRWGVLAALAVVLLELLAVPLVFYVLDVTKVIAPDLSGLPEHPIARFRDQQARGFGVAIAWMMISGMAVLLGGAIAVVRAAIAGGAGAGSRASRGKDCIISARPPSKSVQRGSPFISQAELLYGDSSPPAADLGCRRGSPEPSAPPRTATPPGNHFRTPLYPALAPSNF